MRHVHALPCPSATGKTNVAARGYLHSAIEDIEDLDQLESVKRTANSTLRQAKSVFSLEAMELYEDALNLPLPDLSQFRSKKSLPVETLKYTLPTTETVIKLFDFYQTLAINSPIWIAMTLALYGGLRRSEVIAARRAAGQFRAEETLG